MAGWVWMAEDHKKEENRGFLKKREIRGYWMYHLIKILCPNKRIFTEVDENNESLSVSYVPLKHTITLQRILNLITV